MMRNDVTEDGDTESSGICPRTGSGRCGKSIGKATQMVFFFHIYVCLQEGIESLEFLFFGWMDGIRLFFVGGLFEKNSNGGVPLSNSGLGLIVIVEL